MNFQVALRVLSFSLKKGIFAKTKTLKLVKNHITFSFLKSTCRNKFYRRRVFDYCDCNNCGTKNRMAVNKILQTNFFKKPFLILQNRFPSYSGIENRFLVSEIIHWLAGV